MKKGQNQFFKKWHTRDTGSSFFMGTIKMCIKEGFSCSSESNFKEKSLNYEKCGKLTIKNSI